MTNTQIRQFKRFLKDKELYNAFFRNLVNSIMPCYTMRSIQALTKNHHMQVKLWLQKVEYYSAFTDSFDWVEATGVVANNIWAKLSIEWQEKCYTKLNEKNEKY